MSRIIVQDLNPTEISVVEDNAENIVTVADVGVQGPTSVSTFAGLTDLNTNDVATAFNLKSQANAKLEFNDGDFSSYIEQAKSGSTVYTSNYIEDDLGNYAGNYSEADSTPYTSSYVNKGGINCYWELGIDSDDVAKMVSYHTQQYPTNPYASAGTTELIYTRVGHRFYSTAPSGSVEIDGTKVGDLAYIFNETASSITFIPKTTETFNGASNLVLPAGQSVFLFQRDGNRAIKFIFPSSNTKSGITFGMSGSAISTGNKRRVPIPYNATITRVTLTAKEADGSMVLDILKNGASICASAKPTLTEDDDYNDATLTGWTTSIAAGDTLTWEVESISGITEFDVTLWVNKT